MNDSSMVAEGCDHGMTVSSLSALVSALVRALETMEEELAIRVIPEERSVMLLQVSKTMRTAMQRVSPPAMIIAKLNRGQAILTESVKNAMLDMMKWCRITTITLSNARIGAEGAGRLAAVLGQRGGWRRC